MHCEHCGAELGPKARYCGACGTPVEQAAPRDRRSPGEHLKGLAGRTRRERIVTLAVLAAVVIAAISFAALDPAEEEQTAGQRAADQRCLELKGEVARISSAPGRDYAGQLVAAVQGARIDLQAQAGSAAVDRALRDFVIELGSLGRAIRGGDQAAVTAQSERVAAATVGVERSLDDAGLDRCARAAIVPRPATTP